VEHTFRYPVVKHVVQNLRNSTSTRSALRRATQDTKGQTAAYAYLSRFWNKNSTHKNNVLAFAELAATYHTLLHNPNMRVGKVAARLDSTRPANSDKERLARHERKLHAAQKSGKTMLLPVLRSVLKEAQDKQTGVNWDDVYYILSFWEHPNRSYRTRTRLTVLEAYYTERNKDQQENNHTNKGEDK